MDCRTYEGRSRSCNCEKEQTQVDLGGCVIEIAALRLRNAVLEQEVQDKDSLIDAYRLVVQDLLLEGVEL